MLEGALDFQSQPASREVDHSSAGSAIQHTSIGPSIAIKGEVRGTEPLLIDGVVEGSIHFPEHRVTVGRNSKVTADLHARDVVVMGSVKGNIHSLRGFAGHPFRRLDPGRYRDGADPNRRWGGPEGRGTSPGGAQGQE